MRGAGGFGGVGRCNVYNTTFAPLIQIGSWAEVQPDGLVPLAGSNILLWWEYRVTSRGYIASF